MTAQPSIDRSGRSPELEGVIYGLIGITIFGLTLPATRVAVADLNPVFVGLGRTLVAALFAAVILLFSRQPLPPRAAWKAILITSAGVVLGFPLLATIAMQYAPASHGGVVLAILPLATAVASVAFAGERPSSGFWLCSIAGTLTVLIFALIEGAGAEDLHAADLLLAAAVASAAIGYVQGGSLSRTLGGWQVICWALVFGAPFILPIVLLLSGPINWQASAASWSGFVYVALFSQLIGFFAWNRALALGGVAKIGQLQLLQTFVTLAASAALLGEAVTWIEITFASGVVAIVAFGRNMQVARTMASKVD